MTDVLAHRLGASAVAGPDTLLDTQRQPRSCLQYDLAQARNNHSCIIAKLHECCAMRPCRLMNMLETLQASQMTSAHCCFGSCTPRTTSVTHMCRKVCLLVACMHPTQNVPTYQNAARLQASSNYAASGNDPARNCKPWHLHNACGKQAVLCGELLNAILLLQELRGGSPMRRRANGRACEPCSCTPEPPMVEVWPAMDPGAPPATGMAPPSLAPPSAEGAPPAAWPVTPGARLASKPEPAPAPAPAPSAEWYAVVELCGCAPRPTMHSYAL